MTNNESPHATLTLDQALKQAVDLHQAGRMQDAERLYRAILDAQPNHPDANHNLGVLALQVRRPDAGLPYFKIALEANPNQGQYWLSYIDALIQAGETRSALQALEQGRQKGLKGESADALARRLEGGASSGKFTRSEDEKSPGTQDIYALAALFTEGRYSEAESLARSMTERYPLHAFGWKVLGAALNQMGQSADAVAPLQRAAALSPDDAEMHNNLGITLKNLGRLNEAETCYRQAIQVKPDFAEAHYNLGNILSHASRLAEAEDSYLRALQIRPDYAEAYCNLGNVLRENCRYDDAVASFRRALEIKPDFAETHCNMGNALKDLGRLDEAMAGYRRALEINPDYAEAHNNLGTALKEIGQLDGALASYRRALEIKPEFVEAHNNLGTALKDNGQLDGAVASYHRALEIKPEFVEALNNLALLFNAQGQSIRALSHIKQSLRIKETVEAKSIFVACIKCLRLTRDDREIRATVLSALTEPWDRPSEMGRISAELVKLNAIIQECVARAVDAWPRRLTAQHLFGSDGYAALVTDPLLLAMLNSAPICDTELERFLTMVRHAMLVAATGVPTPDVEYEKAMRFFSALARQCFINEYVFSYTDDEILKASGLRDSLISALEANTQVPYLWLVTVAAYYPLSTLPLAGRLFDMQWPDEVASVLVQQIREPEEEQQLRTTISRLTEIEDGVSLLVQTQYEENPYPRWVKAIPAARAKNIVGYLCQKFPFSAFNRQSKSGNIEVLIAGCGTGQHSIETARLFQGAQVLALDLSLSSLCYAKRKTQELGLNSIEYAQADLLNLSSLGRNFDVIESSGVLHHLADPFAGWQVLLSVLRPNGFMRVGFYSEAARRNIVKARACIAAWGYGATASEIRRCRQDLIELDRNSEFGTSLKSMDFFSISACRDLLFHVQEHRMTLTEIDAFIRENNLSFLGLEIEANILDAYKQRFPDDRSAANLAQWQIYENENPDTFSGMYQFWIQKGA